MPSYLTHTRSWAAKYKGYKAVNFQSMIALLLPHREIMFSTEIKMTQYELMAHRILWVRSNEIDQLRQI